MSTILQIEDLDRERRNFIAKANAGISLPVAGAIYWFALCVVGFLIKDKYVWSLIAIFGSGVIFPLGVALQKPLGANLTSASSVLSGLLLRAVIGVNLLIPLYVALIMNRAVEYVPLALALGMTAHWPVSSWAYGSRAAMVHAVSRAGAVTGIWFFVPDWRFTVLPGTVAVLYFVTALWMSQEAKAARELISKEQ